MKPCAAEFVELSLETVENVDVHGSCNAVHTTLWRQLPIDQFDIGLVLAIACNPYIVTLLDVIGIPHVFIDKHLVDI